MQPLVGLIDYLILGDDGKTGREVGVAFAPQICGYNFMHWSPRLTNHDHDVATGLHPNNQWGKYPVIVRFDPSSDTSWPVYSVVAHSCISFCLCPVYTEPVAPLTPCRHIKEVQPLVPWPAHSVLSVSDLLANIRRCSPLTPGQLTPDVHSRIDRSQCLKTSRRVYEYPSASSFLSSVSPLDINESIYFSTIISSHK